MVKVLQEKLAMIIQLSDPKDYEGGPTQLNPRPKNIRILRD